MTCSDGRPMINMVFGSDLNEVVTWGASGDLTGSVIEIIDATPALVTAGLAIAWIDAAQRTAALTMAWNVAIERGAVNTFAIKVSNASPFSGDTSPTIWLNVL